MKTVYVVLGYKNSGSGSLTYPEDLEFEGFYQSQQDAQDLCDRLNQETIEGMEFEDGTPVTDIHDLPCGDETVYEVVSLDDLKK
jgi:hypothetical protein